MRERTISIRWLTADSEIPSRLVISLLVLAVRHERQYLALLWS